MLRHQVLAIYRHRFSGLLSLFRKSKTTFKSHNVQWFKLFVHILTYNKNNVSYTQLQILTFRFSINKLSKIWFSSIPHFQLKNVILLRKFRSTWQQQQTRVKCTCWMNPIHVCQPSVWTLSPVKNVKENRGALNSV